MATCSPGYRHKRDEAAIELSERLKMCWSLTLDHGLLPTKLAQVTLCLTLSSKCLSTLFTKCTHCIHKMYTPFGSFRVNDKLLNL